MSDLQRYIAEQKAADQTFATNFDTGYRNSRTAVLLRQKCEAVELTQKQVTQLHISCPEERESEDDS